MDGRLLLLPLAAAVIGGGLGYALARWLGRWWGWALALTGLGAAVWLILNGQGQDGMDGLGQVVTALLIAAPAGLGAALGTILAQLTAARR